MPLVTFGSERVNAMPAKIAEKILWVVLPNEICLISASYLQRCIVCMVKGTIKRPQYRIGLKQQYPYDISPLTFKTDILGQRTFLLFS